MNVKWVTKGMMLRRPKILEAVRMATNCFQKHKIPSQYDSDIGMPKGVNLMKLKVLTRDLGVDISLKKMTINESSG